MPYTAKQRRFFYAEADRADEGKATKTGLGKGKLEAMAKEPLKKKPAKKGKK